MKASHSHFNFITCSVSSSQIYQTYADQQCPSVEAGRAKAERIAAYHGIPIDTACVPADLATYANGTVVPYCWDAQPDWSAYRCAGKARCLHAR